MIKAVVIGASAGAIEALSAVLPDLAADYPLPVLLVIHLPPDRDNIMVDLLQAKFKLKVKEVEDKEMAEGGTVYLAPPDYHVLVEPDGSLSLSSDEPVLFSRPSIDVLFESAADAYGAELLGIVLSGGNSDGSLGLRAILNAGGQGVVQRPDSAFAKAMPNSAIAACPEAKVLDLPDISDHLLRVGALELN